MPAILENIWHGIQGYFTEDRLLELGLRLGKSLLIIVLAWLIIRFLLRALGRWREKEKNHRRQTYIVLVQSIVRYGVYFLAIMSLLSVFGLNTAASSLLATAGVGGLMLSFGVQGLVRDMVTGAFLLFEDQYRVGDYVTIGNVTGRVEQVALRTTQLRGASGELYTVPNGLVDKVTNYSRGCIDAVVDVTIANTHDFALVRELFAEALANFADDPRTKAAPEITGITEMAQKTITVRTICQCREKEHWAVERDMRAALLAVIIRHGLAG